MDLDKILSDSPPQKRRQLTHPSLRQYIMSRKPNPSEVEVAELMLALSTSPPPCAAVMSQSFVPTKKHDRPLSGATKNDAPLLNHPGGASQQIQSEDQKKGRRSTTTKRLAVSPSGKPCPNCGADSSTLWRTCKMQTGSSYLCNACGLRYKKGKFCPLCYRVYYDVDTNQLQWRQCQNCLNWTHKNCLQQRGLLTHSSYICLNCRRSEEQGQGGLLNRGPVL
jgi:predicted RNA-binding Zn-ribbon protein involved in translation (DUF1610 family)